MEKIQIINLISQSIIAFLQLIVGISLAYVAYQNYKIEKQNSNLQKNSLRLSLFEKRYKIFDSVSELLTCVMRDGKVDNISLSKFNIGTKEASFMFGREIKEYIDNFRKKALHLNYVNEMLNNRRLEVGEERTKLAEEEGKLLLWFGKQHEEMTEVFREYLSFPSKD